MCAPSQRIEVAQDFTINSATWVTIATIDYDIPRGGDSRLLISVSINISMSNDGQLGIAAVRLFPVGSEETERRAFVYQVGAGSGFTAQFYMDVIGTGISGINVQVASSGSGAGQPATFTVHGGDVPTRSQLLIADMGPR
jgi:hypothetical protein